MVKILRFHCGEWGLGVDEGVGGDEQVGGMVMGQSPMLHGRRKRKKSVKKLRFKKKKKEIETLM